jgi:PKD repeat protein
MGWARAIGVRDLAFRVFVAAAVLFLASGRRFPGSTAATAGVPTATATESATSTVTPTDTETPTATETPLAVTATQTSTATPTATTMPTASVTPTRTSNQTLTPTQPPTPTAKPGASFSFVPPCPTPGQTVSFFFTAQTGATSWSWDFGDPSSGSANASSLQNPTHTFVLAGRYVVSVVARGLTGFATSQQTIRVAAGGSLAARFDVGRPRPRENQTVFFFDLSPGCPNSWAWDFGDTASGAANNSALRDPTHVYATPGVYTVRLLVGDGHQFVASTTRVTILCGRCPILVPARPLR